jgi:hypothetical protein
MTPPGLQAAAQVGEEAGLEQAGGGADRLGGVDQGGVEAGAVGAHVVDGVAEDELDAGVVEAAGDRRDPLLADPGDALVDLAEDHARDPGVLEDLADGATVAAADDEDLARGRVHAQGDVGDELVVDELVVLGEHDHVVEQEQATVADGVVDLDVLVGAALVVAKLRDVDADRGDVVVRLVEPGHGSRGSYPGAGRDSSAGWQHRKAEGPGWGLGASGGS